MAGAEAMQYGNLLKQYGPLCILITRYFFESSN